MLRFSNNERANHVAAHSAPAQSMTQTGLNVMSDSEPRYVSEGVSDSILYKDHRHHLIESHFHISSSPGEISCPKPPSTMKTTALIFIAGLAAALVAPRAALDQAILSANQVENSGSTWGGTKAHSDNLVALQESFERTLDEAELAITHILGHDETDGGGGGHDGDHGHHGHHGRHPGDSTKTIYELIKESKYTTRFAALVDEHDDIKDLLQSTKANRTLFVPADRAFERIPKDHKKPPAEFIRAALAYAIVPGRYPSHRLFTSHTLPTELTLPNLGDHPQRLRVSSSLIFGTHLNFFTKIIAKDISAKNGLIHAVDHILIPPPPTAKIIQLLPDTFSTFSLALAKTDLASELADLIKTGSTAFVPTNRAFARLGPRANAFLFSDHGKKYLKALLQYSIVANETLYSDALYKGPQDDDSAQGSGYWHVDLPSLLHDVPISVDVKSWRGFVSIVANGYTRVAVTDVLGKDGVLQVVGRVLFPPRRRHDDGVADDDGDDNEDKVWSVEELVERLEPYVSGSGQEGGMSDL